VPRELLSTLEHVRLGVRLAHPRYPLELRELGRLRLLQVLLELAEMRLTVGESLVSPGELDELPLYLRFLREDALLDLEHLGPAVDELRIDVGTQLHGLLACLDLRLAPHRLGLALRVVDQLLADAAGLAHPGRAEDGDCEQGKHRPDCDPDGESYPDQHVPRSSLGGFCPRRCSALPRGPDGLFAARGVPHPASGLTGTLPKPHFDARLRVLPRRATSGANSAVCFSQGSRQ
jgi:hypothetical protein